MYQIKWWENAMHPPGRLIVDHFLFVPHSMGEDILMIILICPPGGFKSGINREGSLKSTLVESWMMDEAGERRGDFMDAPSMKRVDFTPELP